jgi:L-alanine-DL-glutamate epimerase-like enolase superfamily enzyme
MQITKTEVVSTNLSLAQPVRMAGMPELRSVTAIFVRLETRNGHCAWGCAVAHPDLTGEEPEGALQACQACADRAIDLHPIHIEYSLAELAPLAAGSPAAQCAFDLAFYDLLGLAAGMPLHRLLGGFRSRIQTSATIPISTIQESVEIARQRAAHGFRILKIKGGENPDEDVRRVRAIHRALPFHVLRLDADGGYTVEETLEVARALKNELEFLEQPTPAGDLEGMRLASRNSPVPILADQSICGPASALELASGKIAGGLSVKMATCGGLSSARQIDAIARAAHLATLVGCVIEPALLIAAGLAFALSSPNVRYGDLDGHFDLINDPTQPGFTLEEGWLVATDIPGLGCTVNLG